MSSSRAIEELVDRFVAGILDIIRQARGARRAEALAVVQSMLADDASSASPPTMTSSALAAAAAALPAAPAAGPRKGTAKGAKAGPARKGAASRPHATSPARKVPVAPPTAPAAPAATLRDARERPATVAAPAAAASNAAPAPPAPREAAVLDAVRSLGQGTAAEIARQGGLPNGTVYVVLRALVARGHVARSDTARGVEYRAAG
jgi:uncharacterized membrane protein